MFNAIKEMELFLKDAQEWTKQHIIKVWDEIGKDVTFDLGLKQTPVLDFNAERDSLMYVTHKNVREGLFGPVVETIPNYVIYINASAVTKKMVDILRVTFNPEAMDHMIRFFLRHECRHIWQAQTPYAKHVENNKSAYTRMTENFTMAHGLKTQERDANWYASYQAEDEREQVLAALETCCQELRDGEVSTTYYDLVKEVKKVYREDAFRKYKPVVLKSTVVAFTVTGASLIAYISKRKGKASTSKTIVSSLVALVATGASLFAYLNSRNL